MKNHTRKKKMTEKMGTFLTSIQYCFCFSWGVSPGYMVMRVMGELLIAMMPIVTAYLGKNILDLLAKGGAIEGTLRKLILCLLLAGLIQSVISLIRRILEYVQTMHNEILQRELTLSFMEKAVSADLELFDHSEYNDKLQKVFMDMGAVTQILWNMLSVISAGISSVSIFFLLSSSNLYYGIIVLVTVIPSSIAAVTYTKKLYFLSVEQMNGERKKGYLQGIITSRDYAQQIRLFHAGQFIKDSYTAIWKQLFKDRKKMTKFKCITTGILECLPWAAVTGISIHVAQGVLHGIATIGDYSLYTGLISQLWSGIFLLSNGIMQIYDNQLRIVNMKEIGKFKKRVEDGGDCHLDNIDEIEFEHVDFTYPGTKKQILYDVSFHVKKGDKVALVGLNGSGKSTIIKLLLRFYDIEKGMIKINHMDIKSFKLSQLHKAFSVYFQNDVNYAFTILDNLKISDLEMDNAQVWEQAERAAHISGAEHIVEQTPNGFAAELSRFFSPDGLELSGGQSQMLALTRAVFRRNSALILDEPSSSLDPEAEKLLFDRLREYMDGKTTILISHRLSNVVLADRIIVMEQGKIAEMGTQEELLKNNKTYARLFNYQREKYI